MRAAASAFQKMLITRRFPSATDILTSNRRHWCGFILATLTTLTTLERQDAFRSHDPSDT
jgi:hypothetical protein